MLGVNRLSLRRFAMSNVANPSEIRRVYMDNAATSFPKPPGVLRGHDRYATELGASAGRGAYHEAVETGSLIAECRRRLNAPVQRPNSPSISSSPSTARMP